jgi:hypothetical protein
MASPHQGCKVGRVGSNRTQGEICSLAQKDANQAGTQQHAQAIGDGVDHGGGFRHRMQGVCNLSQNFGPAVFFARDLGQAAGFQQAAQLSRQDGGFRSQIVIEEMRVGVVQKCRRPDDFIGHNQGGSHEGAGVELRRHGITHSVHPIAVNRLAQANRLHRNGTFAGLHTSAPEIRGHVAIRLRSH